MRFAWIGGSLSLRALVEFEGRLLRRVFGHGLYGGTVHGLGMVRRIHDMCN